MIHEHTRHIIHPRHVERILPSEEIVGAIADVVQRWEKLAQSRDTGASCYAASKIFGLGSLLLEHHPEVTPPEATEICESLYRIMDKGPRFAQNDLDRLGGILRLPSLEAVRNVSHFLANGESRSGSGVQHLTELVANLGEKAGRQTVLSLLPATPSRDLVLFLEDLRDLAEMRPSEERMVSFLHLIEAAGWKRTNDPFSEKAYRQNRPHRMIQAAIDLQDSLEGNPLGSDEILNPLLAARGEEAAHGDFRVKDRLATGLRTLADQCMAFHEKNKELTRQPAFQKALRSAIAADPAMSADRLFETAKEKTLQTPTKGAPNPLDVFKETEAARPPAHRTPASRPKEGGKDDR